MRERETEREREKERKNRQRDEHVTWGKTDGRQTLIRKDNDAAYVRKVYNKHLI